jgi:hypothetical protein
MASTSPNFSVTATSFGAAQTIFDVSSQGDDPCSVYTVHNRDATNYVRVWVSPLHNPLDSPIGAAIAPGGTIPFKLTGGIKKVQVWNEGTTVAVDGFVEAK